MLETPKYHLQATEVYDMWRFEGSLPPYHAAQWDGILKTSHCDNLMCFNGLESQEADGAGNAAVTVAVV